MCSYFYSAFYFKQISNKISLLKEVDDLLSENISENIYQKMNNINKELVIFIYLDILSLILTIFMIYLVLKFIKNEERLKDIIDKSVITSTTNTKGIIIDASQAFCKISGYSKEELLGNPHKMVRHPDMDSITFKKLWEIIQDGKTWRGEVKNLRKDGSFYWVVATIVPIYESGKIVAFISTREDISDKKEVTALNSSLKHRVNEEVEHNRQKDIQLAQQARLAQMGEMISMIAHQWRQPLAAISSLSAVLNLKSQLGSLNKDLILDLSSKITENSKHLSNTIDDFRDFFKPNKEKRESSFNEIVSDVLKIVESSIATKNISIIKDLKNENKFSSYPNEIKQVVLNLIKNADDILLDNEIKEAIIKISTYDDENNIILEISDNAGGIHGDIIDKIFDPYFSTKTKKDGTGLGLYMSKTIIEEHCNGKLIASNSEFGAVFKIIMPKLNKSA
ncbi:MAG: PAS domain-containing sensor histidine kinase [Campylobacteraceae bacterium]|nr:PAS domain-containing sensor histidine kinase [Campylobacteraceae bacterium]